MSRLKVYTLGNGGHVSLAIGRALGVPDYINFAEVLIVAASKADAVTMAKERRIPIASDGRALRVAQGNYVDALDVAGLFSESAVFVHREDMPADLVVRVDPGGVPVVVGRLVLTGGIVGRHRFVPDGAS